MGKGLVARKMRRRIERREEEGLEGLRKELEDSEDRRGL